MRWTWVLSALGLCLMAVSGYVVVESQLDTQRRVLQTSCADWLADQTHRLVSLSDCRLMVDEVLLQSSDGDFELLARRARGLSSKLYATPPIWVEAWVPLQTTMESTPVARAVLNITSGDLMKWVNTLDAAPESKREAMWRDPVILRRLARPSLVEGQASRAQIDFASKFGGSVSVNAWHISPGLPEPARAPVEGILLGVLGLGLMGFALRNALRARTAEQGRAGVISTRDVTLELGALEALRQERRSAPDHEE